MWIWIVLSYISLLQKGKLVFSGGRNKDPNKSKDIYCSWFGKGKYREEKLLSKFTYGCNVIFPWNILCKLCQKQKAIKKRKKPSKYVCICLYI